MPNPEVEELDLTYVRSLGEEIHARLFPDPTRIRPEPGGEVIDGPTPDSRPVLVDYDPYGSESTSEEVLFVVERTIQRVKVPVPDVSPGMVRVIAFEALLVAVVDLTFGQRPEDTISESLTALLRAVTGTL